ncbi:hypothetical protein BDV27DRAFT_146633 [Aspergillus caelatus]|uniref:Aminoglycoside phosphotransferase domain-containing protein n=1 Tax=Aspergillus caelatus TaxID=61420 RepID=A0A5N7A0X2_9EURO|nr:uncharacterized protein BDV27DRAFT_146633 [Aspergillus caelatus]KAE8362826.1 hypothetical protein BDV27DRAFT_146633 [Aspergillus caelatus]
MFDLSLYLFFFLWETLAATLATIWLRRNISNSEFALNTPRFYPKINAFTIPFSILCRGYDLAHHIVSSPSYVSSSRVFNLSSNLIAKQHEPSEVEDALKATEVAGQLGIRGPSVRNIIKNQENAYTIMDRARGTTLDVVWKELGWFMTAKFGLQLHPLRENSQVCYFTNCRIARHRRMLVFLAGRSLRSSGESWPADIAHFFRFWANFTTDSSDFTVGWPMTIEPFILTHHDLAPRNLLYASMYNFNIPQDWGLMAPLRWHLFAWIAIGYHEADARLLRKMRSKLT